MLLTGVMYVALLAMRPGPTLRVVVGAALALHLVGVIARAVHQRREARQYDHAWLAGGGPGRTPDRRGSARR